MALTDQQICQLLLNEHKFQAQSLAMFAMECANESLRDEVLKALDTTMLHQRHIWELMNQKGWYRPAQASPEDLARAQSTVQAQLRM